MLVCNCVSQEGRERQDVDALNHAERSQSLAKRYLHTRQFTWKNLCCLVGGALSCERVEMNTRWRERSVGKILNV